MGDWLSSRRAALLSLPLWEPWLVTRPVAAQGTGQECGGQSHGSRGDLCGPPGHLPPVFLAGVLAPVVPVMLSLCLLPTEDTCRPSCQGFSSWYLCEGRKFSLTSSIEAQVGKMWGLLSCSKYRRHWVKNAWIPHFWALNVYSDIRPPFLCPGLTSHCSYLESSASKLNEGSTHRWHFLASSISCIK